MTGDVPSYYRREISRVVGEPVLYVPGDEADLHMPVETTDAHLRQLQDTLQKSGVTYLDLSASRITSASVEVICSIDSLRQVNVAFTPLTTDDVVMLATRLQLQAITLGHNERSLADMESIRERVGDTRVGITFDRRGR